MMKLDLTIDANVEDAGGDEAVEERVLDITMEEGRRFAAALTDRLEAEGITDIQVRVNESGA